MTTPEPTEPTEPRASSETAKWIFVALVVVPIILGVINGLSGGAGLPEECYDFRWAC